MLNRGLKLAATFGRLYKQVPLNTIAQHRYDHVSHSSLDPTSANSLHHHQLYNIGIARKKILCVNHSALALLPHDTNASTPSFLIFGRQSPADLKPTEPTIFNTTLFSVNPIHRLSTKVDNEKNYLFFQNKPYQIDLLKNVKMNGDEINFVITKVNEILCDKEFFNLGQSNCYTATSMMLAEAIKVIHSRNNYPDNHKNQDIISLYNSILVLKADNCGLGILNNSNVLHALDEVHHILEQRGLCSDVKASLTS